MNDLGVIHLTNGGFTVVDADLFEQINQHRWHRTGKGYVRRVVKLPGVNKTKDIMLHRVVNQSAPKVHTDHINLCKIDNTRRNLRIASRSGNAANTPKFKGAYSSKFKGVYWSKDVGRWRAYIACNGQRFSLGFFNDEKDAALAYNTAAVRHFGEFARLNEIT